MKKITRIGVGGPVGSGKTAIIEAIAPILIQRGVRPLVITNDVVTTEDARHVQRALNGVLSADRIVGVETGACPHTAIREDPSMNLAAVEEMENTFPDSDVIFIESGGDNLTLTFSPALADFFIYVIDVAAGDKIPRKNGPGLCQADILVINKEDLAPYVGASLEVMERDSARVRDGRPFLFTNCKTGKNIEKLVDWIMSDALFDWQKPESFDPADMARSGSTAKNAERNMEGNWGEKSAEKPLSASFSFNAGTAVGTANDSGTAEAACPECARLGTVCPECAKLGKSACAAPAEYSYARGESSHA